MIVFLNEFDYKYINAMFYVLFMFNISTNICGLKNMFYDGN